MERAVVLGAHRAERTLPRALTDADAALVRALTNPAAAERPTAAALAASFGAASRDEPALAL